MCGEGEGGGGGHADEMLTSGQVRVDDDLPDHHHCSETANDRSAMHDGQVNHHGRDQHGRAGVSLARDIGADTHGLCGPSHAMTRAPAVAAALATTPTTSIRRQPINASAAAAITATWTKAPHAGRFDAGTNIDAGNRRAACHHGRSADTALTERTIAPSLPPVGTAANNSITIRSTTVTGTAPRRRIRGPPHSGPSSNTSSAPTELTTASNAAHI